LVANGSADLSLTCAKTKAADAAALRVADAILSFAKDYAETAGPVIQEGGADVASVSLAVVAVKLGAGGDEDKLLGTVRAKTNGTLDGGGDADTHTDRFKDDYFDTVEGVLYDLGTGEDWAEWFQGATDGLSLVDPVLAALGKGHHASYAVRDNVGALVGIEG